MAALDSCQKTNTLENKNEHAYAVHAASKNFKNTQNVFTTLV